MNNNIPINSIKISLQQLLVLLMCVSIFLPPIPIFTDTLLLPKWYLFVLSSIVYVLVGLICNFKYGYNKDCYKDLFIGGISFVIFSIIESLYVLYMIYNRGYAQSGEYGTFDNPAGLALNICIAIPIVFYHIKQCHWGISKIIYYVILILMVIILLLTKCRTGIIALILYIATLGVQYIKHSIYNKCIRLSVCILTIFCILFCTLMYVFTKKQASNTGRSFILQRSIEIIADNPIRGYGINGFEREYMLCQAVYFQQHPESKYAVLADDIHHPLNEFVYIWINHGVLAPCALVFLFILDLFICYKTKLPAVRHLQPLVITVFVFSFFSYPFHYPTAWIVVSLPILLVLPIQQWMKFFGTAISRNFFYLIIICMNSIFFLYILNDAKNEYYWNIVYRQSFKKINKDVLHEYNRLHCYFKKNYYFLYNYAITAFMAKSFDKAYEMIEECSKYKNGYNVELLAGDISYYRYDYTTAIYHYNKARNMCPVRYAPLEGLYKVYDRMGNDIKKKEIANEIMYKEVKVQSPDITRIKEQCK